MSRIIAVPDDLYRRVAELAAKSGVSVDEFVSGMLAKQFACMEFFDSPDSLSAVSIEQLRQMKWSFPSDFKFDREEMNER